MSHDDKQNWARKQIIFLVLRKLTEILLEFPLFFYIFALKNREHEIARTFKTHP